MKNSTNDSLSQPKQNHGEQSSYVSNRYIPVKDWCNHHPWPPEGGLRHLIFNAANNGFDSVVVRINRRVLIDEEAFFEWVNAHKEVS